MNFKLKNKNNKSFIKVEDEEHDDCRKSFYFYSILKSILVNLKYNFIAK